MKKIICVLLIVLASSSWASDNRRFSAADFSPIYTGYFDVNNLYFSCNSNGILGRNLTTGNAEFFLDSLDVIYLSGLFLGARINGQIRTSGAYYATDFIGGIIDQNGLPVVPSDSTFRIYRISRGDNEFNNADYYDWPVQYGAPIDESGKPLLFGDQTLWCSYIDAETDNRYFNQCPPLKAEIHQTVWGWREMDNIAFIRFQIINKSEADWKDAYVAFFADPDLTTPFNDLTGSDSTYQLVYCYDSEENQLFPFQAVGITVLQAPLFESPGDTAWTMIGPKIGFRNAEVSAPRMEDYFPGGWNDFPAWFSQTSTMIYNRFQCLNDEGNPAIDPSTGEPSKWAFSGDPITGSGWLDSTPRDRRIMISTGPLDVAAGDTCELVLAINAFRGGNFKNCIDNIRQEAGALQQMFRKNVGLFSEIIYANWGEEDVSIPIRAINQNKLKKIEFDCRFFSDSIFIKSAAPASRTEQANFSTQFDSLTNTLHVRILFDDNCLGIGKGEVANILFDAPATAQSNELDFLVKGITCWDSAGNQISLENLDGKIEFRNFPTNLALINPSDGQYIGGVRVDFSWNMPYFEDSLLFGLQLIGDSVCRVSTKDTTASLSIIDLLINDKFADGSVDWTVGILNLGRTVPQCDTFHFSYKSRDELHFATYRNQWDFSDGGQFENVKILYASNDTIFLRRKQNADQIQLLILKQEGGSYRILRQQNFSAHDWGDALHRAGNRIFYWQDSGEYLQPAKTIRLYSMDEVLNLTCCDSIKIEGKLISYFLVKNYVYVVSADELKIIKVTDENKFTLVGSIDLSEWQWEGPDYSRRVDGIVSENKFYFADGDWGIFDVSDPESPELIKKIQISNDAYRIALDMPHLYVLTKKDYLQGYDVSAPESPQLIFEEFLGKHSPMILGTFASGYLNLLAHNGFIYILGNKIFDDFEDFALICHYDQISEKLVMDGFQIFKNYTTVTSDWVYTIEVRSAKVDVYQNKILTDVCCKRQNLPVEFDLSQNYPNPFNSSTTIKFSVPEFQRVTLRIYSVTGQEVLTLLDKKLFPGRYRINWNGRNKSEKEVASGIYYARLIGSEMSKIIKIILLR